MEIKIVKNKNFLYKVKEGETLLSISNKFKILEKTLIEENHLASNQLLKGDCLFISCENAQIYVVQPLDNLNKLAQKFNVSPETIMQKNNLTSKTLFIGQKLVI